MLRIATIGLFALALAIAALMAVGVGLPPGPKVSRIKALQAADPPTLWRAEALDAQGGLRAALDICADSSLRAGFLSPAPQVNGQPCTSLGRAVERPGLHAVRCEAHGRRYSVNATTRGDLGLDFTVSLAVRPLEVDDPGARQVVRYRRLGACPDGWRIGDTARPGAARGRNALS